MGRRTYEFGYKYGLQPGQSPYPHMENYIFSKLNPLILGSGIRLFGHSTREIQTDLLELESHDKGLQIITYRIRYPD